jgi:hypothetical protein
VKRFYNHTLTKIMRGSSEKVTQKVKIWKLFLMALLRNSRNSLIKNIAGNKKKYIKIVVNTFLYSDVWLTVHRNSVWIRNQLDVTFV